jgi:hypothetical protein
MNDETYYDMLETDMDKKIENKKPLEHQPPEVLTELRNYGVRVATIAKAIEINPGTISRYLKGRSKMQPHEIAILEHLRDDAQKIYADKSYQAKLQDVPTL